MEEFEDINDVIPLTTTLSAEEFNDLFNTLYFYGNDYQVYFSKMLLSNFVEMRSDEVTDENLILNEEMNADPDYNLIVSNGIVTKTILQDHLLRNLDEVIKDEVIYIEEVRKVYKYVPKILRIHRNTIVLGIPSNSIDIVEFLSNNEGNLGIYREIKRKIIDISNILDKAHIKYDYRCKYDIVVDKYLNLWLTNFVYCKRSNDNNLADGVNEALYLIGKDGFS